MNNAYPISTELYVQLQVTRESEATEASHCL